MPVHIPKHTSDEVQTMARVKKKSQWQDHVTQFVPIMEVRLAILGMEIPSFWDDFHWIPTCKKTQGYNQCWFGIGYFLQSSCQLGLGIAKIVILM
jgi:hypothetical protein